MKVEGTRPGGAASIRKDPKGSGSGFAEALRTEGPGAPAAVAAALPTGAIDGLLALQEIGDATSDRKAAARGDEILDRLEELRQGLLLGRIAPDRLARLAELSRGAASTASDPRLREVLGEIELRAEVELAKLRPDAP
jgi:hypothetical protein